MLVQDVIDTARYSELHGVAVKDNTAAIIAFINMGLLELYKRFPLKMKEHVVPVTSGVVTYSLPDNFMYPLTAYTDLTNPDGPVELSINDDNADNSIFIPNHKQIQIDSAVSTDTYGVISNISLIYVAKPDRYSPEDTYTELDLPDTLVDCLMHYIGYRANLGVRGDGQSENNAHWARFERSCAKALELGVAYSIDSWRMADRLDDRGFA